MQDTQYPNFHRFFHSSWRLVFAKENRSNTALPFLTIQSNFLIPLLSKIKSTYETKFLFHEQNSRWKILDGANLSNVNIIFRLNNPLIILWKKFFVPGDRGKVKKKIIEDHQRKDKTVTISIEMGSLFSSNRQSGNGSKNLRMTFRLFADWISRERDRVKFSSRLMQS